MIALMAILLICMITLVALVLMLATKILLMGESISRLERECQEVRHLNRNLEDKRHALIHLLANPYKGICKQLFEVSALRGALSLPQKTDASHAILYWLPLLEDFLLKLMIQTDYPIRDITTPAVRQIFENRKNALRDEITWEPKQ